MSPHTPPPKTQPKTQPKLSTRPSLPAWLTLSRSCRSGSNRWCEATSQYISSGIALVASSNVSWHLSPQRAPPADISVARDSCANRMTCVHFRSAPCCWICQSIHPSVTCPLRAVPLYPSLLTQRVPMYQCFGDVCPRRNQECGQLGVFCLCGVDQGGVAVLQR